MGKLCCAKYLSNSVMKIEEYINLAKSEKEIDGISLIKNEVLNSRNTICPKGHVESTRWTFSDGTVILFDDETDDEPGWRGHNRSWKFEVIGDKVSYDSAVGVISKRGCV
jgi:hypothetical protein